MIAAVEWIPAGRANPTPSKYEFSRAEQEFMARVQGGGGDGDGDGELGNEDEEQQWEDVDVEDDDEQEGGASSSAGVSLPEVDPSTLPADLRMDEYSDDDDEEGKDVGGLLVGKDAENEMMDGAIVPESTNNVVQEVASSDRDSDSDSEDEDDLADIPDTREFMGVDVEGLQSIGIGGGGGYSMEDLQNMTMNNNTELLDDGEEDEEDDEDDDDIKLQPNDALVVVAKTEEDYASLEINIFDTESSNLYVHHDIPLPSFPLCLALGSVVSSYHQPNNNSSEGGDITAGNYVAVGSFEPGIEIWNLDVMNALEPTVVLGGMDTSGAEEDWLRMQMPTSSTVGSGNSSSGSKKKNKKKKSAAANNGLREGSHTDAIMGLSWNTVHQQVLASGSADGTVKLWDVSSGGGKGGDYIRPSATLTHHTDKVQSLMWHPSEGTLLATGGYDRKICLVDARSASATAGSASQGNVKKAKLLADCEALAWDPHNPQYLTAASEDGVVQCWDVRKFGQEPVWSIVAHEYGGVSDICYNSHVPGMLMTCSIDKTVALWDTQNGGSPHPCGSKDMNVGKLHSVSCYPSSPWLLACGGSGNSLAIWDMESEDAIQNRFAGRVNGSAAKADDAETEEPNFEALMAAEASKAATDKANATMNKSKKNKKGGKGKKKNKAHKKK